MKCDRDSGVFVAGWNIVDMSEDFFKSIQADSTDAAYVKPYGKCYY